MSILNDQAKINLAILITCGLMLMSQCNSCRNDGKSQDAVKDLTVEVTANTLSLDSLTGKAMTPEEFRHEQDQSMYSFLIYEDDLDKGKISKSEIKNKIEDPCN